MNDKALKALEEFHDFRAIANETGLSLSGLYDLLQEQRSEQDKRLSQSVGNHFKKIAKKRWFRWN